MSWECLSFDHPIITAIRQEWTDLLSQQHSEAKYHAFLLEHAGLFLADGVNSHVVVSKLKLGSRFELDFAVAYDRHSEGLFWELIEIKTPHVSPYRDSGNPSSTLVEAVQQVQDWKGWLIENRSEAKRLFSSDGIRTTRNPNFSYTIVIGNRENSEKFLDKRNKYGEQLGINIRSFDYLTDRLARRPYMDKAYLGDGDWDSRYQDLSRELANPFTKAFGDSSWKRLLSEPGVRGYSHFTSHFCERLLTHRAINLRWSQAFQKLRADV